MSSDQVFQQALDYHQAGQFEQAERAYLNFLATQPQHADALHAYGVLLHQRKDFIQAEQTIRKAIALRPKQSLFYNNLANVLVDKEEYSQAIALFEKAIQLNPKNIEFVNDLGLTYKKQNNLAKAEECYRRVITQKPTHVAALINLGNVLRLHNDLTGAVACYQQAINVKPNYTLAYCNYGKVLMLQGKNQEALSVLQKGHSFDPNHVATIINLMTAFQVVGRLADAKALAEQAIQQQPSDELRYSLGIFQLALGETELGWQNYESRFAYRLDDKDPLLDKSIGKPRWQGEDLSSKCIYLYAEQGVGDEVMFALAFAKLIEQAEHVIIASSPRLVPIMQRSFASAQHVDITQLLPFALTDKIDYEAPFASLMQFLYPRFEQLPQTPAYLVADQQKVLAWQQRLAALGPGPKIGISWRGGLDPIAAKCRSTSLKQWQSLLAIPDCHFINLQYGDCREALSTAPGTCVQDFDDIDPLRELDNFFALTRALDLVISIDNSTVHIAGSLGVPCWVMLPLCADWRWGLQEATSHWYPSLQLFRQGAEMQWAPVFKQVSTQLVEFVNKFQSQ